MMTLNNKQMDYKKVIASLQYFVDNVGKQFEGESENEQEHRKKPE